MGVVVKRILAGTMVLSLMLPLGGCVISVRDDGAGDWGSEGKDWRRRQEQNQQAIDESLQEGDS